MKRPLAIIACLCLLLLTLACSLPQRNEEIEEAFHIEVQLDAEGVYELQHHYTVKGVDEGRGGVRNADKSLLKKGEILSHDFYPGTFHDPEDYADFNIVFSVIDEKGDSFDCAPLHFEPALYESYRLLLRGSFREGFTITW